MPEPVGGWFLSSPWVCIEEERAGKCFEDIQADYIKQLEEGIDGWEDDRLGYTQCDKCYERGHKVQIKDNGTIGQWIPKWD